MLDLTKPVRFKGNNSPRIISVYRPVLVRSLLVEYQYGDGSPLIGNFEENLLENIPEPKVARTFVGVYKGGAESIFLSICNPEYNGPIAKITYTEGAENPWAIEGVK